MGARNFSVFDSNIDEQTLFIDVGGWIGSTSLYAAQIAKKTLILEPDPIAFKRLKGNLGLNLNILSKKYKIFLIWLYGTKKLQFLSFHFRNWVIRPLPLLETLKITKKVNLQTLVLKLKQ